MNATRLIVQLVLYYLVIVVGMWVLLTIYPELRGYLPVGGAEALIKGAGKSSTLEAAATAASVEDIGRQPRLDGGGDPRCSGHRAPGQLGLYGDPHVGRI